MCWGFESLRERRMNKKVQDIIDEAEKEIPWIDARDVKYIGHRMYQVVIYARRRFHYDVFIQF